MKAEIQQKNGIAWTGPSPKTGLQILKKWHLQAGDGTNNSKTVQTTPNFFFRSIVPRSVLCFLLG